MPRRSSPSVRSQRVAMSDSGARLLAPTRPSGLQRGLIQDTRLHAKLPTQAALLVTCASKHRARALQVSQSCAIKDKECSAVHRHSAPPRLLSERQRRRRSVPRQRRLRRLVPRRRPEVSSRAQQPHRLAAQQHPRHWPHPRRRPARPYLANRRPQQARRHSAVHLLVPPQPAFGAAAASTTTRFAHSRGASKPRSDCSNPARALPRVPPIPLCGQISGQDGPWLWRRSAASPFSAAPAAATGSFGRHP